MEDNSYAGRMGDVVALLGVPKLARVVNRT